MNQKESFLRSKFQLQKPFGNSKKSQDKPRNPSQSVFFHNAQHQLTQINSLLEKKAGNIPKSSFNIEQMADEEGSLPATAKKKNTNQNIIKKFRNSLV